MLVLLLVTSWLVYAHSQDQITAAATAQPLVNNQSNVATDNKQQLTTQKINKLIAELSQIPDTSLMSLNAKITLIEREQLRLNTAEQYLLAIAKARLAQHQQHIDEAINLLKNAQQLEASIDDAQLNSPDFYQLYLMLADLYAKQGKFQQAYDQKQQFFDRYLAYHQAEKQKTVATIKQQYQTDLKQKQNQLLEKQNQLEASKIAKNEQQKQINQRNSLLIFAGVALFIVLLYRQLRIKMRLKYYAEHDVLTQLYNRKVLFQRGAKLFEQAKSNNTLLSVVVFDIDHFKQINDTFGHQAGDQVLMRMAALAKETMRTRDILARLGGEEFVAIMPELTQEQAKACAERLREKFEQQHYQTIGINRAITASFGVASIEPNMGHFDQLVHCADEAMYQAKQSGRNQVVCFNQVFEQISSQQPAVNDSATRKTPRN
jgi:diguanylate cyclase (GGDEF)-like protein